MRAKIVDGCALVARIRGGVYDGRAADFCGLEFRAATVHGGYLARFAATDGWEYYFRGPADVVEYVDALADAFLRAGFVRAHTAP